MGLLPPPLPPIVDEAAAERARVAHALEYLKLKMAFEQLKAQLNTPEGLQALRALFPPSELPHALTMKMRWLRCRKTYEPVYEWQDCRMHHPAHAQCGGDREMECERCGKGWSNVKDDHETGVGGAGTPRGYSDDEHELDLRWPWCGKTTDPGWCYSGPHEPDDRRKVAKEGWEEYGEDEEDEGED